MMEFLKQFDDGELDMNNVRPGKRLLTGINGAKCGMMFCNDTEFGELGDHDDQEGFLVLEGDGEVYIDGKSYPVSPDTAILLQAHQLHTFRRNASSCALKIFWFHSAI